MNYYSLMHEYWKIILKQAWRICVNYLSLKVSGVVWVSWKMYIHSFFSFFQNRTCILHIHS
jgi:hypothetical protein